MGSQRDVVVAEHASELALNVPQCGQALDGFELEHGSLRAVPHAIERPSLYDRNPTRFWQLVSALLFVALLIGTVLLVGLLNYVPALALGPVVEHFMLWSGR